MERKVRVELQKEKLQHTYRQTLEGVCRKRGRGAAERAERGPIRLMALQIKSIAKTASLIHSGMFDSK